MAGWVEIPRDQWQSLMMASAPPPPPPVILPNAQQRRVLRDIDDLRSSAQTLILNLNAMERRVRQGIPVEDILNFGELENYYERLIGDIG